MDGTSRIDELEQKFIENPRRYFAPLANEYRKAGNPHQAIAICRAHLGQLPGHMSGQIVYGQALFEGGEFAQARTVFENALAMDRENLVALRHLGDLSLRDGETAAARQWYMKLLEFDPQDAAVITLVSQIDSGAVSPPQSSQPDAPPAAADAPAAEEPVTPPTPEPATFHSEEEDNIMAEELGYPVPPQVFVTETMAELYLSQGFRDRALNVYRQLLEGRPDDERLKTRLAELEQPSEAPVVSRSEEAPSVETPAAPATPETPETPETPSGDSISIDAPPSELPANEPDSVEAPSPDESRAEPEATSTEVFASAAEEAFASRAEPAESTAAPVAAVGQLTVRDFFASLGRRKPSSRSNGTSGSGATADARAATALAGAFGGSGAISSPTAAAEAAPGSGKESEEDVARFRAWLDGLTGE